LALIEASLRDRYAVCRVDAAATSGTEDLVAAILAALGADPRGPTSRTVTWQERLGISNTLEDAEVAVPRPVNETDAAHIAHAAERAAATRELVVMIDNLRPVPAHSLFGRFRDTLWAAPVVWVAAGDGDRDGYLDEPADVFWEQVEWLEPLDKAAAVDLLQRRIEAASAGDPDVPVMKSARRKLSELLDGGTPRELVRAAAQVADTGSVNAAFGTAERFERAHAAGGRSAAMLLAELERIGRPVHAGDDELLTRMGITRARIVQLLSKLADAELVKRHREGRRIMFEASA